MSKQEFIDRLRAALNGKISPGQVMENINYYEDYINMQIRAGKTEKEVLEELGDPRLIARTIVAAQGQESIYDGGTEYQGSAYRRQQREYYEENRGSGAADRRLPRWLWVVIVVFIVAVVIGTVLSVLSFLAPIIIPILVVVFLVKLFRDWLN